MNSSSWKSKDNPPTWLAYGAYDVRQAAWAVAMPALPWQREPHRAQTSNRETKGGGGDSAAQSPLGPALVCQISVVFGGGVHLGSLEGAKLQTKHTPKAKVPKSSP